MHIIIVDDNGLKHEEVISNGKKGIGPDIAIRTTLRLFQQIYPPGYVNYILRNIMSEGIQP